MWQDARFSGNPRVIDAPNLRFYAAQPLRSSDGYVIGTLCVLDTQPRQINADDLAAFADLAALAEDELNFMQAAHLQARLQAEIDQHRQSQSEALKLAQVQQAMFDTEGVLLIGTDTSGLINIFNAAAEQKLGYTAAEVIGKATPEQFYDSREILQRAELLSAELGQNIEPGFATVTARAKHVLLDQNEWTHVAKDGSRFQVRLSITPIRDADRVTVGYIGVAIDVSARKEIEHQLAISEARFRDIVETMPGVIYQSAVGQAGWRMNYISPNVIDITGVSAEAIVENLGVLVSGLHPDDVTPFINSGATARTAMQFWKFEGRSIKPSGELRWWQATSVPHMTPDGEVVFNGIMLDVTDYKRAGEALRANQEWLMKVQNVARVGYWTLDMSSSETTWSDLMFDLLDVPRDSIPSFGFFLSCTHPDDREAVQQIALNAVRAGAESYEFEARVLHRNGKTVNLYTLGKVIRDADGNPLQVIGTSQDVTDYRQATNQIRLQNESLLKANGELAIARKQAEAANKLKSQFLATMSHELRTPLNAIIGYAQLQLAGMAGDISQEQADHQERILVNAQHLLEMINEVLDLSKIEAGRVELAARPFNVRHCLHEAVAQSQVLADAKNLSVALMIDAGLPDMLIGDVSRLKQIVLNLLSNAVKFTATGSVRLTAHPVSSQSADEASWQLIVTDTGIGIPTHMHATIFNEFRQVDSSSTRQYAGTGLGLAIVRRLVLMMRGSIHVASEIGQGSSFTVTLPIVPIVAETAER